MMIPLAFGEEQASMTSIITNISAMAALQTLRTLGDSLATTQDRVSSGLRVGTASDNAAYWSISTTMHSDTGALSAVSDALGLGAAKVDTAYAGMEAVVDVLSEFKAKLVAASEDGVDKTKIQEELEQLKQQVVSISQASSFSGQNWLNTDIEDIYDKENNSAFITSGYSRSATGGVAVQRTAIDLSAVSLFNKTGGGLLQADARVSETVGGIRSFDAYDYENYTGDRTVYYDNSSSGWMYPEGTFGSPAGLAWDNFPVGAPLDFNLPGAEISFNLLLDKEMTSQDQPVGSSPELNDLPGPYFEGEPFSVSITKTDVDNYDPLLNGVVSTNTQFVNVLNKKLEVLGAGAEFDTDLTYNSISKTWVHDPKSLEVVTLQKHGFGSYIGISNLTSTNVSTGGLAEGSKFGTRGSGIELKFEDFIVHEDGDNENGIEISFTFSLNNEPATTHSFNRTYVNEILGKDTGKVATPEEMAILLHSLLDADWPDLVIEATADDRLMIKSDPTADRQWGSGTAIDFANIRVSNEPLPTLNFLDIDITENPDNVAGYIDYLEVATARVISGTALIGAVQMRIEMQTELNSRLTSMLEKGIGRLVDADMNEESTRLKALQTQEQLAIQSLSIANSNSETVMQLFR